MNYNVYSVFDEKTGFGSPTLEINDAVAIRNFKFAASQPGIIKDNPKDFTLYQIAEYDTDTAKFIECKNHIVSASDFAKED